MRQYIKKISFLVILIFVLIINSSAMTLSEFENLSLTEAKTKAKELLSKDHPEDNATIKVLLEREMKDFKKLKRMYFWMSEAEKKILERLLKDYDCWFSTVLILYEEKIKDMKALEKK